MRWSFKTVFLSLLITSSLATRWAGADPKKTNLIPAHPIFRTPVTGKPARRPAIQIDILNERESWFGKAELYLSVQSSRFPDATRILLPLNVGDFAGVRSRFVQLPFEVLPEDVLMFHLLDEDSVPAKDVKHIEKASRLLGYCVWTAGSIYLPEPTLLVTPKQFGDFTQSLGTMFVQRLNTRQFDHFGAAEHIVQESIPDQPNKANKLTIVDHRLRARIQLRIYAPRIALDRR